MRIGWLVVFKIDWESEATGTEIVFKLIDEDNLHIKVIGFENLSLKLNPEVNIETTCSYNEFLKTVIKEIDRLIKKYGIVGYRETWYEHDFPLSTFLKLKHYILNLNKYPIIMIDYLGDELAKTDLQNDIQLLMMEI